MNEITCAYCGAPMTTVRVRSLLPGRRERSERRCTQPHDHVRTYRDDHGILHVV